MKGAMRQKGQQGQQDKGDSEKRGTTPCLKAKKRTRRGGTAVRGTVYSTTL
jgi:hypothetical protein